MIKTSNDFSLHPLKFNSEFFPEKWMVGRLNKNLGHPQIPVIFMGTSQITLPESKSSPLKISKIPKGNDHLPTIHFQVLC